ncbi:LysM peptidoglycan-binding domain-containing protein [Filobacillus milosensis]|uniref:LysM peptidoglycan-binding domain-containing protein n=1 Tax=Filobacillus milosensis TaxID=94137 RepID=A0A4Y8IR65_9BACI|nr:cell wall hydrolase [Filobacillus milosensis]TFB24046.1 LysM peptidoglycan-binding domain-containing protein [Filobacillus milosensis]
MRTVITAIIFALTIVTLSTTSITAEETTKYSAKSGDSLWKISQKYDVPLEALQRTNNKYDDYLKIGETLTIPTAVSNIDKGLLARLVQAEAKGESYAGKVAVATVVLNRVDSNQFPNSVKEVIYEKAGGHYAFTPVKNGQIKLPASQEAKQAVEEALEFRGKGNGSLYFYNPATSTSSWVFSRETTITIGKHRFAK